ncbi:replication A subunit RPA32 [Pyrrhoderma noxium]|uniref:Replication A subunit RPA32 n=1 Tax=Pyrrhoderma noxium TaxID=2282107 RepID=A0A286UWT6_9AGAM|nr:replication A subunit RPA32 [Pyrrhoderma noxium]
MFGGNDYGAGFMQNSPSYGSQGSPGGERRGSNKSIRPLTIKQIMRAGQTHTDAEMYIDGVEISQITTVAQVINAQVKSTNRIYTIDDGTGRIEARAWLVGDDSSSDDKSAINDGAYVRVTEVVYVSLVLQRGPPNEEKSTGSHSLIGNTMSGGPTNTNYSHYASSTTVNDGYKDVTPIARRIVEFIASQPRTEEGVHVASIARHIHEDAGAISRALDELMDSGHVYSTIDESHFALS